MQNNLVKIGRVISEICSHTDKQTYMLINHNTSLFWRRGVVVSGVRRMNEVNARRARLLPGWVTVFWRVYHLGM